MCSDKRMMDFVIIFNAVEEKLNARFCGLHYMSFIGCMISKKPCCFDEYFGHSKFGDDSR